MKTNIHKHAQYPYKYYQDCSIITNCNKVAKRLRKKIKETLKARYDNEN